MPEDNSIIKVESSKIEKLKTTNRILIVLLVVASFFLGSLTNQVASLKKNSAPDTTTAPSREAQSPITNDTIKAWAKDLGLNTGKFNSCFDETKYQNLIDEDLADGQKIGVNGTPTFYINGTILVGAQPYESFKAIIEAQLKELSVNSNNRFSIINKAYAQAPSLEIEQKVSVTNGHLPKLGDEKAKIKIVEFSDFECPFCKKFVLETFPDLKKDYIDTGKAVLYYRQFPLNFHPLAQPLAQASECANEQGKFWEFHDKVFSEQP